MNTNLFEYSLILLKTLEIDEKLRLNQGSILIELLISQSSVTLGYQI